MKKNILLLLVPFVIVCVSVALCVTIRLFSPYDKNGRLASQGNFPLQWQWHLALPEEILAGAVAEGNIVIVRTRQDVYAIQADAGTILWKANIPLDQVMPNMVVTYV